jgi:hypothetical protein
MLSVDFVLHIFFAHPAIRVPCIELETLVCFVLFSIKVEEESIESDVEARWKEAEKDHDETEKSLLKLQSALDFNRETHRSLQVEHDKRIQTKRGLVTEVARILERLSDDTRQSCSAKGIPFTPDHCAEIKQGEVFHSILNMTLFFILFSVFDSIDYLLIDFNLCIVCRCGSAAPKYRGDAWNEWTL